MRYPALLSLLSLIACDSGTSLSWGDPQIQIVEGAGQTATAAVADSLDKPVRAQLYQTASGGITFRVVPEAHAQATANLRGVSDHQVCAVPGGDVGLQPWNPCAKTNGEGLASFFFEPGTKAGEACAEIRAVIDDTKVVAETVCATVEPGPVHVFGLNGVDRGAYGDYHSFSEYSFMDWYMNPIPFTVEAEGAFEIVEWHGRPAIGPKDGARTGDTATLTFYRGSEVLLVAIATLLTPDSDHWGVTFTY